MNDWVEADLMVWGQWARGNSLGGYSTPLARLTSRAGLTDRTTEQTGYIPERIEIMEQAVARLGLKRPRLKKIIMRRYIGRITPEELGTDLNLPTVQVEAYIHEAITLIARDIEDREGRLEMAIL